MRKPLKWDDLKAVLLGRLIAALDIIDVNEDSYASIDTIVKYLIESETVTEATLFETDEPKAKKR